jgi:hypothetical protein
VQQLLEAWGETQVPAADLVEAAKEAAAGGHMATLAVLIKELRRLYPDQLHQLFEVEDPVSAVDAAAALTDAWAADVSSIDEQRAAVRRREEDVASERQAVQHLIVGMACMAKAQPVAQAQPTRRASKRRRKNS